MLSGTMCKFSTGSARYSANSPSQPFLLRCRRDAAHFRNFADKLVPQCPVKIVVAAKNFDVRVADSRQPHSDKSPTSPQSRQRSVFRDEFVVARCEREHFWLSPQSVKGSGQCLE